MAIAFDAATDATITGSTTSLSFAHTCTGTNRILFVGVGLPDADVVSGVTYAGASMTFIGKAQGPSPNLRWVYLFGLANPASGSNNVVISCGSTADALTGTAVSYTGAKQTGLPDASTTNTSSGTTSITTSVTTVADNCWTVLVGRTSGSNMIAGTGTTKRGDLDDTTAIMGDSNSALTPAGSKSMQVAWTGSGSAGVVMASFAPFVEEAATRNSLTLLGVS